MERRQSDVLIHRQAQEATVQVRSPFMSRRNFATLTWAAAAGAAIASSTRLRADDFGEGSPTASQTATGAAGASQPTIPAPDSLKSEHLMDLVLQTEGNARVTYGAHTIVAVTGGTFEGPRLKGTVAGPGADWPLRVDDRLRILDVRTILVTDDDQRIYCSYRGVVYTPAAGQGQQYWRITPIFETSSEKYAWLNRIVAVGVRYSVPQRVAYRVFQIL